MIHPEDLVCLDDLMARAGHPREGDRYHGEGTIYVDNLLRCYRAKCRQNGVPRLSSFPPALPATNRPAHLPPAPRWQGLEEIVAACALAAWGGFLALLLFRGDLVGIAACLTLGIGLWILHPARYAKARRLADPPRGNVP